VSAPITFSCDAISVFKSETQETLLNSVSLQVHASQIHALIGESGSGKSTLLKAAIGLLHSALHRTGTFSVSPLHLGYIPQSALASLSPMLPMEVHVRHTLEANGQLASTQTIDALLQKVGLTDTARIRKSYAHQLSGGMQQRMSVALALAKKPVALLADEPTTALDASKKQELMDLLRELATQDGLPILFVTHDLKLAQRYADQVSVLYAGRIVESQRASTFFSHPKHPYSKALISSQLTLENRTKNMPFLEGKVPLPSEMIPGCRFAPRCPNKQPKCEQSAPALENDVACFYS
jgi:peptide/nickel transport system ATP-binding protein